MFFRYRVNALLLTVFLLAGFYGLYQGFAFKSKQVDTINAFRQEKEQALSEMLKGFQADTTTADGKAAYLKLTAVNTANWYTVLPAYKWPNSTSVFSIGQADVFPYYVTVKLESFFMQLFKQNELANPLRSLAGHFDVAFWIVYLLPLLIIIFSFHVLPAELDNQNWRLINSQGVSAAQWVRSKLTLIGISVFVLVLIVFTAGLILNYNYFDQLPGLSDGLMLITILVYLLFWIGALYLINAFSKTTRASALYSGTLWIVICIVIPSLTTSVIEKLIPVDNTAVSRMSRRPQDPRLDNNQASTAIIEQFKELKPLYKGATIDSSDRWFGFSKYFAYHELLDDTSQAVVKEYYTAIEKRQRISNLSILINPAAGVDGLLTNYAANDAFANHQFIWNARDFHRDMRSAMLPPIFFERTLSLADYQKLPDFSKQASGESPSIPWLSIVLLIIASSLIFLLGNSRLRKGITA